uniref:Uncharacterized protein n=1 Tax=Parascaris equorum TaxID=6256 RepID=A0A914S4B0_PAREQ
MKTPEFCFRITVIEATDISEQYADYTFYAVYN